MANYYYSKNPDVKHQERDWNFELLGNQLKFITDNGVFSKNTVDFGTRVLLNALEKNNELINKSKILDVGCGYGPIGLAIAKKYPQAHVDMVDVNELALELAKKNANINEINNVSIYSSDVFDNITSNDYQMIISNPPIRAGKKVVHTILNDAFDHLAEDGLLTIVIQKKQGAASAKKKMETVYGNCQLIARDKGYQILQSKKKNEI